ncbi:helix-turn-helix domain-containing protein [Halorubellus sp. PRR65]|uniref:helix-turn-helix domain-containing protein n=1 Tax=Halorubellus sp. PRR65 TaxID=3098148 RepID=UPI002B259CB7|nr:helix-turn-helix domain-containing protein [Halorubellus sp. PRR65]
MQSADLTLALPEPMQLPVPEWVDGDEVVDREEVLSWQVRPAEDAVYFLSLVSGDLDAVREIGETTDVARTVDVTPVEGADAFYVYAEVPLREADSAFMSTFDAPGLVVVPPLVYTATDTVHVTVLGEADALSGVLEALPDAVDATVERVSEHGRMGGALAGRLTRRQFQAIAVARDVGYYDVPRDGDLAAVATELGISESPASTLLRNAERALVDAALGRG